MDAVKCKLNPFFRIRFHPRLCCDLFLEETVFDLPSTHYLTFLTQFKAGSTQAQLITQVAHIFDVSSAEGNKILENLMEARLIIPESRNYPELPAIKHWVQRGWTDALILHLKTRNILYEDEQYSDPERYKNEKLRALISREEVPSFWKLYPDAKRIELPQASHLPQDRTFSEILLSRRSNQPWQNRSTPVEELSNIFHYANLELVQLRQKAESMLHEAPEALLNSSFCALETYLMAFNVDSVAAGIYHYDPKSHALEMMQEGDKQKELVKMCIGQPNPLRSSFALVISVVWERYMFRYRHPRAYRNLLVNVSELAQKYLILATTYRYSQFLTPAFDDLYADHLFGLNGYEEAPIYAIAIG